MSTETTTRTTDDIVAEHKPKSSQKAVRELAREYGVTVKRTGSGIETIVTLTAPEGIARLYGKMTPELWGEADRIIRDGDYSIVDDETEAGDESTEQTEAVEKPEKRKAWQTDPVQSISGATSGRRTLGPAEHFELDPAAGKWAIYCDDHNQVTQVGSRREARRTPTIVWCTECFEAATS